VNILGIETSSIVCSVGLANDSGVMCEKSLIDPHIHSEKLLTLIREVLKSGRSSLEEFDAIAVSIGPGSFTGLRIGLSTAKGLCYSLEVPLITIGTFDAVSRAVWDSGETSHKVHIAVDAKQGEFYFATYFHGGSLQTVRSTVETRRLSDLPAAEFMDESAVWVTDREDAINTFGVASGRIHKYSAFCSGGVVARLGIEKHASNDFSDLSSTEPMYLKEFVAKNAIA
jgi:tRNA threonylcarbamoyladenosine biosynthesis protein TsaB